MLACSVLIISDALEELLMFLWLQTVQPLRKILSSRCVWRDDHLFFVRTVIRCSRPPPRKPTLPWLLLLHSCRRLLGDLQTVSLHLLRKYRNPKFTKCHLNAKCRAQAYSWVLQAVWIIKLSHSTD